MTGLAPGPSVEQLRFEYAAYVKRTTDEHGEVLSYLKWKEAQ